MHLHDTHYSRNRIRCGTMHLHETLSSRSWRVSLSQRQPEGRWRWVPRLEKWAGRRKELEAPTPEWTFWLGFECSLGTFSFPSTRRLTRRKWQGQQMSAKQVVWPAIWLWRCKKSPATCRSTTRRQIRDGFALFWSTVAFALHEQVVNAVAGRIPLRSYRGSYDSY